MAVTPPGHTLATSVPRVTAPASRTLQECNVPGLPESQAVPRRSGLRSFRLKSGQISTVQPMSHPGPLRSMNESPAPCELHVSMNKQIVSALSRYPVQHRHRLGAGGIHARSLCQLIVLSIPTDELSRDKQRHARVHHPQARLVTLHAGYYGSVPGHDDPLGQFRCVMTHKSSRTNALNFGATSAQAESPP